MELLRLSKFKLQLRALITDARELRERERCATEQLHLLIQKQKQKEEEVNRKLQELHSELTSSIELRRKLESEVKYFQNDNVLLENKQKELKRTIDSLLQSRESFESLYEDSTCEMKRSIEIRDRKLAILSQKIHAHLLLFDVIEKEAFSVKQVVENVEKLVSEKEDVVAGLKRKMDRVSAFEKEFVQKICFLEKKLRNTQDELRRKDIVISELHEQLEALKISNNFHDKIEELQKALSLKEEVIQNISAEKKALRFEVGSLEIILRKFQEAITNMNAQDQKIFSSVLEEQQECATMSEKEDDRSGDMVQESGKEYLYKDTGLGTVKTTGSPLCQKSNLADNPLQQKHNLYCTSEHFVCSPSQSACSDPQSATNIHITSINGNKGNCTQLIHNQLDSESSTTEAETSKDPATYA